MMMATNLNITSATPSAKARIASLGRPVTWVSAMAKSALQNTTCSTSFRAAASKKLWGTTCSRKEPNVISPFGCGALGSGGGRIDAHAGLHQVAGEQPDPERDRRHDPEIRQRLECETADALQIVAVARDAHHQACRR